MLGLTLDQAKNVAIAIVVVFVVGALASAWLMKTVIQKLVGIVVLGLLAFAVWSQRSSLQDCADKVRDNIDLAGANVAVSDTECEFFGLAVTISDPRSPE